MVEVFAQLVRAHRRRLRLTQDDLAARSGIDVRAVRRIESGDRSPRPATVRRLADALLLAGADRDEFFAALLHDRPDRRPSRLPAQPAQLPLDIAGFAGRGDLLGWLNNLVLEERSAVVISAISGPAGVGKTALAVHWAHLTRDRFTDGQLYVNLRGFDPSGSAMDPGEAVRVFLDGLGIPPQRIPRALEAQLDMYRTMLSGRRVLVVLDNARDAAQVRPLLPGAPGCLAVVTSRNDLSGLVAADSVRLLTLDVLSQAEAWELLDRRLGPERLAAEPEAVRDIVDRCGRLPLALAVAAARAARHPTFPLATLAAALRQAGLEALAGGDERTDVRAVFSWSYHSLSPEAARLFRFLGLHPGPEIPAASAASLVDMPRARLSRCLVELTSAHLIAEHRPNRYMFHDPLRTYAAELVQRHDSEPARRSGLTRLLDHLAHTAHAADRLLNPHRDAIHIPITRDGADTGPQRVDDQREGLGWLATEHRVLLAALQCAERVGLDAHTWQLAWVLDTFLERQGHWHDRVTAWRGALRAAHRLGQPAMQGYAVRRLASTLISAGRYEEARPHAERALDLSVGSADPMDRAAVHRLLAKWEAGQGRLDMALYHAQQALAGHRAIGNQRATASSLNAVGWYEALLGQYDAAIVHCEEALDIARQMDDVDNQAATWHSLGFAYHQLGQYAAAARCYRHASALQHELGERPRRADVLNSLGDTLWAMGDLDAARTVWRQALEVFSELGHPATDAVRAKLAMPGGG